MPATTYIPSITSTRGHKRGRSTQKTIHWDSWCGKCGGDGFVLVPNGVAEEDYEKMNAISRLFKKAFNKGYYKVRCTTCDGFGDYDLYGDYATMQDSKEKEDFGKKNRKF